MTFSTNSFVRFLTFLLRYDETDQKRRSDGQTTTPELLAIQTKCEPRRTTLTRRATSHVELPYTPNPQLRRSTSSYAASPITAICDQTLRRQTSVKPLIDDTSRGDTGGFTRGSRSPYRRLIAAGRLLKRIFLDHPAPFRRMSFRSNHEVAAACLWLTAQVPVPMVVS